MSKTKKRASLKKTIFLTSMVLPGAIWFFFLRYLPMAGIVLAFKNYKVYPKNPTFWNNLMHSAWSGLKNFEFLFATTDSWIYIRNTICYNVVWIALGLVIAVAFAIMLHELTNKFVAKTYQTLMFFPYFLSWVVASYFLLAFLDPTKGLIDHFLMTKGLEKIDWYNTPKYWPFILTICNLWKNIGYSSILYLAAITGIDTTQYEAAAIDGATKWQQIFYVTIPNLRPMICILLIMNVGKIFNSDFGLFYTVPLNSGSLFSATQVIDTYIYRVLTATNNIGMSTAGGLLQNAVGFVCIMFANKVVKKIDEDSALF
ncbi:MULTISPECIES: ABC transporter permease [unclassified Butyrivibrio]|uniref:ABC transporter permease n=1 Tax=unclassified Butyrivibrio TaxID=2639466 RepID=UPI0008EEA650|nr:MULTISPECIES: ABC transporter permease subunit [unclassified Butyrivibrio]RKM58081.1 sugar ABC transporter permease [Butyrivibrio sp. X503]RKM63327.1 sugar ABC transporter permease [Butyrivibrio sp. XB500-5]SFU78616.1 putative aldouronate transport system permease protein [Butyrivibrio sp. INlla21]